MVELTYLNLSGASFSGKIPPQLGNLTKLDALDLSFNWLITNGDVEWISQLSTLKFLGLSYIDFSKASNLMQVLTSLPLLSSLRLRYCRLQNIHCFSLSSFNYSSFLSRIQLLDLSQNQLSGPIPKAFQNMTSLKYLYLSSNQFTAIFEGGISTFIGNNCGLKELDLSWNSDLGGDVFGSHMNESMGCSGHDFQVLKFEGTSLRTKIPVDWLGKFKNLKSIDLRKSGIYGPIPASLGNLSSLEYLDLSSNALIGVIPSSIGRLFNLRELNLKENRLEEVGDECFIQLANLKVLDISRNLLKSILTEAAFANLSELHSLSIGHNELLSLDMKPNWIPPFQLTWLAAGSCVSCFGSQFPQWLQTQKSLEDLVLSNMSISSAIPTWLTLQNLTTLDLSHNQMVGPLFTAIVDQMPNLKNLFLKDNRINDSLLSSLCKLKNLFNLDLSNNRLSGMVQGCLLTPNLYFLDLSSNNFSGTFPYSHGNLSNIRQLYLRNNNFEGSVPIVLKNSKYLDVLDLEGNKFSGNIPTWVGNNLGTLVFLRLRGNFFNGTIPSTLCKLTNLQMLDLAHNQLQGRIPPNLNNFNRMTRRETYGYYLECRNTNLDNEEFCFGGEESVVQHIKSSDFNYSMTQLKSLMVNIDLSKNYLVGFIPSEIILLKGLFGLNLSHNNLTGTIPTGIGEMEALESLDLSFNRLSGPIPRSISELNTLGVLKLSHNNLSGEIPREGHLSTFNEVSSFDNNPYLCGEPLPMKCAIENPSEPPLKNIDNLDQEDDKWEKRLLYIMIVLGYIVGFWAVVGTLILKKSWRNAYFKFVDEVNYKVHAAMQWSVEMLKGRICFRK
ncbi:unnamed protein product [Citrullus colocynthis]|uniref:Disease resistance R13L4/SHOC-2-like LRR domain-containing protein n=1 Tax=Citrullus colocynthis TaxID=252529 RepID=A0ABP0XXB3_9ROSI